MALFLVFAVIYTSLFIGTTAIKRGQSKAEKQFVEFFGMKSDNKNIPEVSGRIQDKVLQLLDQNDLLELDRAIEIAVAVNYSSSIGVAFFKLKTQIQKLKEQKSELS